MNSLKKNLMKRVERFGGERERERETDQRKEDSIEKTRSRM
jgi:hypothetical protein